jgi:hypothetical protein
MICQPFQKSIMILVCTCSAATICSYLVLDSDPNIFDDSEDLGEDINTPSPTQNLVYSNTGYDTELLYTPDEAVYAPNEALYVNSNHGHPTQINHSPHKQQIHDLEAQVFTYTIKIQ